MAAADRRLGEVLDLAKRTSREDLCKHGDSGEMAGGGGARKMADSIDP
jgi:hypothetical protein